MAEIQTKSTRGRKPCLTDSGRKRKKKEVNAQINRSRIYIGDQYDRWNDLKVPLGVKTHADLTKMLLDRPKDRVDSFYFKPLVNNKKDQWLCKVLVGHNTSQKNCKKLCTAGGLEGKRTNHSLWASIATRLYQAVVEEKRICETTDHRSNAVRSYKRTANFQQKNSSEILYGKNQKTRLLTLRLSEENPSLSQQRLVLLSI